MKNIICYILFMVSIHLFSQENDLIQWKSIQQADSIQQKGDQRLILVDIYTEWCGPCKLMDRYTFHDQKVVDYINENFIPVKFNAESKENVTFKGKSYQWVSNGRGGGIQALAYFTLGGEVSYPSIALINARGETVFVITGFYQADDFLETVKNVKKEIIDKI
ncbi:DUF255 domain-containing protein [Apibacter raozihei]|uniref:thioredoxin family protein n=1 Tax=Apibacter raozihei TaxID=2500547 RepID=UPI000FE37BD9|nr:DUF255 domain-containing protein [Apibacter raozihei]